MKQTITFFAWIILIFSSCTEKKETETINTAMKTTTDSLTLKKGVSEVNGIGMYYEIYGYGKPLVLIHGGGSTIETSFGRIIPLLSTNHQLICVELQAHGRTSDRNSEISFEQDADDVAALLKNLHIEKADILGFSNGGNTALQIAIRHPQLCDKIIAASILLKRDGAFLSFLNLWKTALLIKCRSNIKMPFSR